jgi:hypothetical protein
MCYSNAGVCQSVMCVCDVCVCVCVCVWWGGREVDVRSRIEVCWFSWPVHHHHQRLPTHSVVCDLDGHHTNHFHHTHTSHDPRSRYRDVLVEL